MMTTIDKAAVGWTIAIVAIALIFVQIYLPNPCLSGQTLINGKCVTSCPFGQTMINGQCVPDGEEFDETLTMENVITMRILRIDSLLNYLNTLPDFDNDEKKLFKTKLGEIQSDIKSNSSLSAYNKLYQFREHFDGTGTDELVSDSKTRLKIYNIISDILISQSKTLFLPIPIHP